MENEVSELAALAGQAAAMDAQIQAHIVQPEPVAEVQPDSGADIRVAIEVIGAMLTPVYPSAGATLTKNAEAMGASAAPVLAKYGIDAGGLFARFGPEIGMLAVWLPVGLEVVRGVRQDNQLRAERLAEREAAANAQEVQQAA
jgi:hypothetical protein